MIVSTEILIQANQNIALQMKKNNKRFEVVF